MKRILVVDDENAICVLLKAYLVSKMYEIRVAEDSESVRQILKNFQPDLTIADIMMLEESGFSIISTIRQQIPSLKVIYLSAWIDEAETERELQAELRRHPDYKVMKKPFDLDVLQQTIENFFN